MTNHQKYNLKFAVRDAMRYYPNAHLGDNSRLEDLKSAFRFVRSRINKGFSLDGAISELEFDTFRYVNM